MTPLIKVIDLKQTIGKQKVLDGLSLELYSGECLGLFGARGAGKTALLHILSGIDRFKSGSVEILGCDIRKSEAFKKQLGLVTQERSLFRDLKVYENLEFIAVLKNTGLDSIPDLVKRFELTDYLGEPAGRLNAGVYQRLSMACALLNEPRLLIADDLINDIDPYAQRLILKELNRFVTSGGACVWGFSRIEFCAATSRVGWLEKGSLTFYTPQEAQEQWESQLLSIEQQSGGENA
ncbi:ATP-binding cassette domain-containing protein [Pelotomaculum propionicicum]|uniref:Putative ABC transporter ATP-binding protein YbhF n=1 Tax=Pelotomaculum propionicicum TaxID=258475 RepID=A0A4Y7RXY6_9FIRM|nr:ABC transporter ATP-binding protein [Pelotomaculum propionicicum]NLI13387.1 ABC transporter ATP-binding protein [Peptococcaceae bacterium]TEB13620.1 putative ABC transporter ATP-binding protein YbhF [Pelotomaculum propionicicum]